MKIKKYNLINNLKFILFIFLNIIFISNNCFSNTLFEKDRWLTNEKYDFVKINLLSGNKHFDNQSTLLAGIQVKLSPGWKIYWRNPGDAGLPPEVDWKKSKNIKSLKLLFPNPKRFNFYEIETFGYENEVIFPLEIDMLDKDKSLSGILEFNAQVCSKICVPVKKIFNLFNLETNSLPTSFFKKIEHFKSTVPVKIKDDKLKLLSFIYQDKKLHLILSQQFDLKPIDIIIEDEKGTIYSKPYFYSNQDLMNISIDVKNIKLDNKKFHLTFLGNDSSFEKSIIIKNIIKSDLLLDTKKDYETSVFGFKILIIAFLGGIILNFMPCVLPVLSLKMIQLVNYRNVNKSNFRYKILFNILGILTTFIALGLSVLLIKLTGNVVGWGIQFQNQYFLIFMILLTLMFSLNLFGVFQFYLPSKFLSILSYRGKGLIEDFMNGMFMTLLATPCSAPLVGTAVGFALAGSNIDVFTIFIIMGFGLSFPLIIFLIFPSFISFIPKPGNWLNTFKKIMALMLLGTSIWLISILFKLNSDLYDTSGNLNNSQIILNWNMEEDPFLPTKLAKDGKIVFLDITADWCITCKVNKLLAVDTKDMIKFFKKNNVVIIKLDWTKPDIKISEFLSSKNRYGIPFNEVYGPSELYGILLPELLSKNIIKKYINLVK